MNSGKLRKIFLINSHFGEFSVFIGCPFSTIPPGFTHYRLRCYSRAYMGTGVRHQCNEAHYLKGLMLVGTHWKVRKSDTHRDGIIAIEKLHHRRISTIPSGPGKAPSKISPTPHGVRPWQSMEESGNFHNIMSNLGPASKRTKLAYLIIWISLQFIHKY